MIFETTGLHAAVFLSQPARGPSVYLDVAARESAARAFGDVSSGRKRRPRLSLAQIVSGEGSRSARSSLFPCSCLFCFGEKKKKPVAVLLRKAAADVFFFSGAVSRAEELHNLRSER